LITTKFPILVTGAAGFIGYHLSKRLLEDGFQVVGLDNFNDYYDVGLKRSRLEKLKEFENFQINESNLEDVENLKRLFEENKFEYVVNLAAQAGVRYSLENPFAYTSSNITGFVNILERCKDHKVKHLLYASSSSVYGANTSMPFSTSDNIDHPISLYAATKKANELLAHTYSYSYDLPSTGLRFFTVYGPWGRPDMALFKFTKNILEDKPIDVYNHGNMMRDFTYIDDIVEGVYRLMGHIPQPNSNWSSDNPDPSSSFTPYSVHNIGNSKPVKLMEFVEAIESEIGKKAQINYLPLQTGDVPATFADVTSLESTVNYKPATKIADGISNFVTWYRDYYKL
jgi:UDP-glucuronate 4-epimerase